MNIPFNRTHSFGKEYQYIKHAIDAGEISGNGYYTQKCHQFFKQYYDIDHCLLTNSCTAALEMAAILLDIEPGDEVIIPSYGYVSTANAFVMRGAKLVYVDSQKDTPNLNVDLLKDLITDNTKAIVVIHYGGFAVDMDAVMTLANGFGVYVVEDAAHCIDAYYKNRPLGTIGHFGAISFHSSKNITSGHGGLLLVNDDSFVERSQVIWQKGTDKTKFDLGNQAYYKWIDIGSSFFPSDITAAYLYAQLLNLEAVTAHRLMLWDYYYSKFDEISYFDLPNIEENSKHNGHIFYVKFKSRDIRTAIIDQLRTRKIIAHPHYLNLAESKFQNYKDAQPNTIEWEHRLLRFPLFFDLSTNQIDLIVEALHEFNL